LGLAEVAGSRRPWVVLDGILGTGAAGPPRLAAAELIGKLIQWRESRGVFVVAIDIPSGLNGESGVVQDPSVVADLTATLGAVKSGLLADGAIDHVGRLSLLPLTGIEMLTGDEGRELIDPVRLREWWRPSDHSLHKGLAGRVAVVAGSPGMTGAAALTAGAALHAGAGLVTVWTHPGCVREVAMRCPPEIMVRTLPQGRLSMLPVKGVDVVALGPGCGDWLAGQIPGFYRDCPVAMVVDADGLNHIAPMSCRVQPVASRLLTPHAGEFARLAPDLVGYERAEQARRFVDRHVDVCLLLKGGRTLVARRGSKLLYNGTGHYGMAGAGMGDVLTGICAAMVCRTGDSYAGAALAAWLHGRAAELATPLGVRDRSSLTASEVIGHFGAAAAALSREDD